MVDIRFPQQVCGFVSHFLGMGKQPFARRRQRHAVGSSVEEPLTQLRFKPVDSPKDGRAMDSQGVGCRIQRTENGLLHEKYEDRPNQACVALLHRSV